MNPLNRVRNAVRALTAPSIEKQNNSTLANEFLRFGARPKMGLNIDDPVLSDEDLYTGYGYAIIERRANRAVELGTGYTYTKSTKKDGRQAEHPYLKLINDSLDFTAEDFWYEYSRYMDLEGVFYVLAVRGIGTSKMRNGYTRVGNVKNFEILNPYQVRRVFNTEGELGGYIESRDGMQREIPVQMIIPVIKTNPVDRKKSFSMGDAASDAQFVLKQAADYQRKSIRNNINAPGLITSDVIMEDHEFENFKRRVLEHTQGEPIFSNGKGAIAYTDTSIDLNKSALTDVNGNNRDQLIAIGGTSKNQLGLDQSGTGRETARVQKDDFTENAIMPLVKKLIGALNMDYKRYYPDDFTSNGYEIALHNPLSTDYDNKMKEVELSQAQLTLKMTLISSGYEEEIATQFVLGEIDLAGLGMPTLEPEITDEDALTVALKETGATPEEIQQIVGTQTDSTEQVS
tara:strand:- start:6218 stop:7591 length:1374 start_codon:yes stop_codon:yes gene_type:complete